MNWKVMLSIAISTSILERLSHRYILKNLTDSSAYTVVYQFTAAIFLLILINFNMDFSSLYELKVYTICLLFVSAVFWALFGILGFTADKYLEASYKTIISRLRLVWAICIGIVIFNEELTKYQYIGIGLILLSVLFYFKSKAKFSLKGFILEFLASLFVAIAIAIDKYLIKTLDPYIITFCSFLISGTLLGTLIPSIIPRSKNIYRQTNFKILLPAIAGALSYSYLVSSLEIGKLSVIIPIYQAGTLLTVFAAIIFLQETEDLVKKIIACTTAILGSILVFI